MQNFNYRATGYFLFNIGHQKLKGKNTKKCVALTQLTSQNGQQFRWHGDIHGYFGTTRR
jgi:hypothetical protein